MCFGTNSILEFITVIIELSIANIGGVFVQGKSKLSFKGFSLVMFFLETMEVRSYSMHYNHYLLTKLI